MIDQTHVNLLPLIERDTSLKKVASTGGGEYHGPCPFCGGEDRFIVQPSAPNGGRWSCRQCSPRWGDSIAYVMQRENITFSDALDVLGIQTSTKSSIRRPLKRQFSQPTRITYSKLDDDQYPALCDLEWQKAAKAFIYRSQDILTGQKGSRARDYLLKRGIPRYVYCSREVGYNPDYFEADWGEVRVKIPRGIILPWRGRDGYLGIRVRLPKGGYVWVKGSTGKALYNMPTPRANVVLMESEMDVLALWHAAHSLLAEPYVMRPVATGGTSGARAFRWQVILNNARRVILAFDNDEAGHKAASYWESKLSNSVRLVPTQKDPGDMIQAGEDMIQWLRPAMNPNTQPLFLPDDK